MTQLFEPYDLCGIKLKNRFVRSATCENLTTPDRLPSEELIRGYEELARGGVGLIITSATRSDRTWDKREFETWKRMSIDMDKDIPSFKALTERVHALGARVAMQLGSFYKFRGDFVALSPVPYNRAASMTDSSDIVPRALTVTEIREIIKKYGEAGGRAKKAGFDAVQIAAAHGFPICQFFSPYYNRREDEYGGNGENRARFVVEIMREIKKNAGKDFPVLIKMNVSDFFDGGMTVHDAAEAAGILARNGMAAIETSGGALGQKMTQFGHVDASQWEEGYFRDYAGIIKSKVNIPIILVGGLRNPVMMENVIAQGKADLVSMSRPLIKEPEIINRWKKGDRSPSDCTSCNGCLDLLMKGDPVVCVL